MARRTRNYQDIEESGWTPDESFREWCEREFPKIDIDRTFEVFVDKSKANDWVYASWSSAFKNYIRLSDKYGGAVEKSTGSTRIPSHLIQEAQAKGFRKPHEWESVGAYRTALRDFNPKVVAIR